MTKANNSKWTKKDTKDVLLDISIILGCVLIVATAVYNVHNYFAGLYDFQQISFWYTAGLIVILVVVSILSILICTFPLEALTIFCILLGVAAFGFMVWGIATLFILLAGKVSFYIPMWFFYVLAIIFIILFFFLITIEIEI